MFSFSKWFSGKYTTKNINITRNLINPDHHSCVPFGLLSSLILNVVYRQQN